MESSKSTISKIDEWTALQTFLVFVTLSTLSNPLKEFIKERCTVAPILLIIINNTNVLINYILKRRMLIINYHSSGVTAQRTED